MIPERGVSYYGVMYPDQAQNDFNEMLDHGCNAVLLAISEFDWWFWKQNVTNLIKAAHDRGFKAYLDLWGWGKTLAGQPPSIFLMKEIQQRQIAVSGKIYNAACFNHREFRDFLNKSISEIISKTEVDGFFWDEPHYANWYDSDWACCCSNCLKLYKKETGDLMPKKLTPELIEFRENCAIDFLNEISQTVKEANVNIDAIVCLLPTQSPLIGITNWERIASLRNIDVLATDPYWFHKGMNEVEGLDYFKLMGNKVIESTKINDKRSQLWIQAFNVPKGREKEILKAVEIANEIGVYSIFAWPYRAGEGSILASDDPKAVWDIIGNAFRGITG